MFDFLFLFFCSHLDLQKVFEKEVSSFLDGSYSKTFWNKERIDIPDLFNFLKDS